MKTLIINLIPVITISFFLTSVSFSGEKLAYEENETTSGLQLMSEFVDSEVKNQKGENLGRITEVSVDQENWHINYAVLLFEGNKLFAIPMNALTLNQRDKTLMLNINKTALELSNGFSNDNWPAFANPRLVIPSEISNEERYLWERTFNDWEKAISTVTGSSKAIKGDDLLSFKIEETEGKRSGTIKDLVVDTDEIKITYAIVSLIKKSEESAGENAMLYVIPMNLLKINSQKTFNLNYVLTILNMKTFPSLNT